MAVHDHTAPARLSFPSLGDPFIASPAADPMAQGPQAHSPCHATLDDVALAHYALAQLWFEDEQYRVAKARCLPRQAHTWPLPPLFKDGVSMAIRCLEQYAKQLSDEQAMNE
ncbi:hypothetical protein ISN76_13230 [Dyella halodurans]|uniref:Uncharacterized protein n=1 Tax=Dyella halodurans TaxID=1920171 RepID=A0ABV9BZT0_9GAMM|nr:hypothetical protein [Dyella halodurans]